MKHDKKAQCHQDHARRKQLGKKGKIGKLMSYRQGQFGLGLVCFIFGMAVKTVRSTRGTCISFPSHHAEPLAVMDVIGEGRRGEMRAAVTDLGWTNHRPECTTRLRIGHRLDTLFAPCLLACLVLLRPSIASCRDRGICPVAARTEQFPGLRFCSEPRPISRQLYSILKSTTMRLLQVSKLLAIEAWPSHPATWPFLSF